MFCFYKSQEIQFYLHTYSGTYLYSNLLAPKLENFSKTALEKLFIFLPGDILYYDFRKY